MTESKLRRRPVLGVRAFSHLYMVGDPLMLTESDIDVRKTWEIIPTPDNSAELEGIARSFEPAGELCNATVVQVTDDGYAVTVWQRPSDGSIVFVRRLRTRH